MTQNPGADKQETVVPLHVERVALDRRQVETGAVRVSVRTETHQHPVDENLTHIRVVVERIPIGRIVETAPAMRTEGDITTIPVFEEIMVVERRLVLKEEIILRRVRMAERRQESVTLREQEATVERIAPTAREPGTNESTE